MKRIKTTKRYIFGSLKHLLVLTLIVMGYASTSQVAAQITPEDEPNLKEYVGTYAGRNISLSDSTLVYSRDGMPMPAVLKNIGEDSFEVVIPPGARVRGAIDGKFPTFLFDRNSEGKVMSLSIIHPDGSVMATHERESESN